MHTLCNRMLKTPPPYNICSLKALTLSPLWSSIYRPALCYRQLLIYPLRKPVVRLIFQRPTNIHKII